MATSDQDLKKKRLEVISWLSEIVGNDSIPDFESNPQTIELLHQLSMVSRQQEKNSSLYIDDLKEKAKDYNNDSQRVNSILSKMMLSQNSFSPTGLSCLQTLAQVGAALNVRDPSDASFLLSMKDLQASLSKVSQELLSHRQDTQRLSKKMQDVLNKNDSLEKTLVAVEKKSKKIQSQNAERKEEVVLLQEKTEANNSKISKLKIDLSKTGLSSSCSHGDLVKKREKLEKLETELGPMKAELESFASLPPNAVEAKIKIEQLKRKLHQVQAKMTECIETTNT